MANEIIRPFTPLTIPFMMFPSSRSDKELISGIPGIRYKTEVANAYSGCGPICILSIKPEISDDTIAARKIQK
jgi:hypothetical protein